MTRNSFIQISKLTNLKGRIDYITNPKRQENLYAVYDTADEKFWSELGKCNRLEFKKSGSSGKCIESRELIIALPEPFCNMDKKKVLKDFTELFKKSYGVNCIAAMHHNKTKTNLHIHLIFSEREELKKSLEKVATRNMFYDENGKHVRTKKEIEWESIDGKKIKYIFLLAIPNNTKDDVHIKMLSELARSLMDQNVISKLEYVETADELLNLLKKGGSQS